MLFLDSLNHLQAEIIQPRCFCLFGWGFLFVCFATSRLFGPRNHRWRIMKLFFFCLRGLRSSVTAGEDLPFLLVLMRPARTLPGFLSQLSEQDLEIKSHRVLGLSFFLFFSSFCFFQMALRNNALPSLIKPNDF